MSDLKPCPFCGSNDVSPNRYCNRQWVDCDTCGARCKDVFVPWTAESDYKLAIGAWNTRTGSKGDE